MAVFPILFDARNPKRFTTFHINVVPATCATPLPFEFYQSPTVEVESSPGFGLLDVRNPRGTIGGIAAALEFDVAQ